MIAQACLLRGIPPSHLRRLERRLVDCAARGCLDCQATIRARGRAIAIAHPEARARLEEIERENARAAAQGKRCPGCGCTRFNRCVLNLGDGSLAQCAPAGDVPGHETCSACLTPDLRTHSAAWRMPDQDTINEIDPARPRRAGPTAA